MPVIISKEKINHYIFQWEARHDERLTPTELARRAGITREALYRLMSGEIITPDLRKLHAVAKVLECKAADLLHEWTTESIGRSKSSLAVDSMNDELASRELMQPAQAKARREIVAKYKGWIVREQYSDRPDVVLLRPGANSSNPTPDDIRLLEGEYAEEWRKQNPPEVGTR